MFDTGSYNYGSSLPMGFLEDGMQQSMSSYYPSQNSFSGVMSSLSTGVSTNASQGITPWNAQEATSNLSPSQIAAQMSVAGPLSVLPLLGKSFLPQLIFPIAGLWSLVDGMRSMAGMHREFSSSSPSEKFDPKNLSYYKTLSKLEALPEII
jgi:hypothetical protein